MFARMMTRAADRRATLAHARTVDAFAQATESLRKLSTLVALPAERLPHGCQVKVCGEWETFDGYDTDTGLMRLTSGTVGWSIVPLDGETFVWRWLGF
jgi:hypothetical protein